MIASLHELRTLLSDTPLSGRQMLELLVLDTPERAFAIEIRSGEVEESWRIARGLLSQTGRWPVVVACWSGFGGSWSDTVKGEDLFSRFYFEEAKNAGDVSPRSLLAAAQRVDVQDFLARMADKQREYTSIETNLEYEIDSTAQRCGSSPDRDEVERATLDGRALETSYDLDRWLLHWEVAHGFAPEPISGHQNWFDHDPIALLFLPTPNSWDALAYLHFFAASPEGSEHYIGLGRSWEERFGAELVAHYGTMLQCITKKRPRDLDEAWTLAREHDLAAPCTLALPGIPVREHARYLLSHDRWFLHERP